MNFPAVINYDTGLTFELVADDIHLGKFPAPKQEDSPLLSHESLVVGVAVPHIQLSWDVFWSCCISSFLRTSQTSPVSLKKPERQKLRQSHGKSFNTMHDLLKPLLLAGNLCVDEVNMKMCMILMCYVKSCVMKCEAGFRSWKGPMLLTCLSAGFVFFIN